MDSYFYPHREREKMPNWPELSDFLVFQWLVSPAVRCDSSGMQCGPPQIGITVVV
jgi:hypothetical protein